MYFLSRERGFLDGEPQQWSIIRNKSWVECWYHVNAIARLKPWSTYQNGKRKRSVWQCFQLADLLIMIIAKLVILDWQFCYWHFERLSLRFPSEAQGKCLQCFKGWEKNSIKQWFIIHKTSFQSVLHQKAIGHRILAAESFLSSPWCAIVIPIFIK